MFVLQLLVEVLREVGVDLADSEFQLLFDVHDKSRRGTVDARQFLSAVTVCMLPVAHPACHDDAMIHCYYYLGFHFALNAAYACFLVGNVMVKVAQLTFHVWQHHMH